MTAGTGRSSWWWGPSAALAVAVLWLALVAWRPATTFHLAPGLVTASWAVTARWTTGGVALRRGRAARCVAGAAMVAIAATIILLVTGHLQGPDLLGGSAALTETLIVIAATAPITWWAVTRTRRAHANPDHETRG